MHLVNEGDRANVIETSKQTQLTGNPFTIEYHITTPLGEKRVIQEHGYGMLDNKGSVSSLFGTAQDITERKRAEEKLKISEAKYRAFFKNSLDGILLTVTDGKILSANPAACEMFRMTEEEICAKGRYGLIDHSDSRAEALITKRQLTGTAKGELTFLRKDGSTFPGEISSAIFSDSFGRERTSMILKDITERNKAEEKIKNSEAKYRTLFEQNLADFYQTNAEGQILECNQAFAQMLKYDSVHELLNTKSHQL